jgi:hypothetical protein
MNNGHVPKEKSGAEPSEDLFMRQLKHVPEGCLSMCVDGVMRSFGGPPERIVIDAVGLSPAQIKQRLDLFPWSQEKEDLFRGVDGRKVVDHEALYNPPDSYRPPKWTAEELVVVKKEIKEKNSKLREQMEKERAEGVDVDAKYFYTKKQADYDLSPKTEK